MGAPHKATLEEVLRIALASEPAAIELLERIDSESESEQSQVLFIDAPSKPDTPTTGLYGLYFKNGGLYYQNDAGVETRVDATEGDPLSLHLDGSNEMGGNILFAVDGSQDIGTNGANRPASIYTYTKVEIGNSDDGEGEIYLGGDGGNYVWFWSDGSALEIGTDATSSGSMELFAVSDPSGRIAMHAARFVIDRRLLGGSSLTFTENAITQSQGSDLVIETAEAESFTHAGDIVFRGGNASGSGNNDGGGITLETGRKTGSGIPGAILIKAPTFTFDFDTFGAAPTHVLFSQADSDIGSADGGTTLQAARTLYLNTSIEVGGNQVIGAQETAEADVTGTAVGTDATMINDLKTTINSLLAKLRSHGLIDT